MKNLSSAVRSWLESREIHATDVVKVSVERDFVFVSLYVRDEHGLRIVDDEFGNYVEYTKKYPLDTADSWWV